MNRSPAKSGVAAALIAALVLAMTALPAFAQAPAKATASITTARTIFQGLDDRTFTIEVKNADATVGGSQAINYVNVFVPVDVMSDVKPVAPQGWEARTLAGGARILYYTVAPVFAIPQGGSKSFSFTADVARAAKDELRQFGVSTSNDGLVTASANPSGAGALDLSMRMIELRSIALTGPTEALDRTVTSGQNNVGVKLVLVNHGANDISPIADVTGAGASSDGAQTPLLPKGGTTEVPVDFVMTFDGTQTKVVLSGDAKVTGVADGVTIAGLDTINLPEITVQGAVDLKYVSESLNPKVLTPGSTANFTARFYNPGPISASELVARGTRLKIVAGSQTAYAKLVTPDTIGSKMASSGNDNGPVTFTFEPVTLIGSQTQVVDAALTLEFSAKDANGWIPPTKDLVLDGIKIDPFAPVVENLKLTPQASAISGVDPAIGNGRTATITGDVLRSDKPCLDCSIAMARIRYEDKDGKVIGERPLTTTGSSPEIEVNKADGKIATTITTSNIPVGTVKAYFELDVRAKSGLPADGNLNTPEIDLPRTSLVDVDIVAPKLAEAVTGPGRNEILVTLSETVRFPVPPTGADFNVPNHLVSDAKVVGGGDVGTQVRLTLTTTLGQDETPSVSYQPPITREDTQRAHDRVNLKLTANSVTARDGIVPLTPELTTVGGQAEQQDDAANTKKAFFTNLDEPAFVIAKVTVGHAIEIWRDNDGNGYKSPGDTVIVSQCDVQDDVTRANDDEVQTCYADNGFNIAKDTESRFGIIVRVRDVATNFSQEVPKVLVLDKIAPRIVKVTKDGATDILVEFNEAILKGSNSALNWTPTNGQNAYNVASVSANWNIRRLTVDDFRYSASTPITKVYYDHFDGARYVDRAGNSVDNMVFDTGTGVATTS